MYTPADVPEHVPMIGRARAWLPVLPSRVRSAHTLAPCRLVAMGALPHRVFTLGSSGMRVTAGAGTFGVASPAETSTA
jgi:hypothetical protein